MGLGAASSTEGTTFSLIYIDQAVGFSDYTFKTFLISSVDDLEAYGEETVVYGYQKEAEALIISPGYHFTPNLDLSLSLNYMDHKYRQLKLYGSVPTDYWAWSLGASLNYHQSDYKLFYNDGLAARINWRGQVSRSDELDTVSSLKVRLAWDKLLFAKHALQLGLRGEYQNKAASGDVSMFGRGKGYRGIEPNGLWTSRITAVSADYQIPVGKWGHGIITVAPFIDYGNYKSFFTDSEEDYLAYGLGAYYFFNFINLPGLGLTIGKNDDFIGGYIAIQIGGRFN
jgi:hypothetical protein